MSSPCQERFDQIVDLARRNCYLYTKYIDIYSVHSGQQLRQRLYQELAATLCLKACMLPLHMVLPEP